jgi:chorismate-pyruvate lyase
MMSPLLRQACAALIAVALAAVSSGGASAQDAPWRGDYVGRLEALALLQSLNASLLSNNSATLTLDRWCADHRIASPARITAERVRGADKAPTDEQRRLLGVGPEEPVNYRHVRLRCGARVLSEADNWYVPARLTPDMNRALETTDVAFGRAVQALRFQRRTLSAKLLWSPLPEDWARAASPTAAEAPLRPPSGVIEHHAVLTLPDGTPFSEVVETYTGEVLAFPEPPGH